MPLTKRQKEVLNYLRAFLETRGYAPTLEEIACHFHLASLNSVYKHLKSLEERGFIKRLANQARSIQILDADTLSQHQLPLLGQIAAGEPVETIVDTEEISVPENFLSKGQNYVLKVRGDSMIEEHIQDGDYVIVERREEGRNGETVIALIDGENSTIKKFYRESGKVRLQPANPALQPVRLDENRVKIQGVVVGIMRKY